MTLPKLTYFDAPVSRGEECRLALHIAGVKFEDVRIKSKDWPLLKPIAPYGSMPYFEIPGRAALAHSNAILVYIGRENGLHPLNHFEAARHEGMMAHVEDLRGTMGPTMHIADAEEKKHAREKLVANYLPNWAERAERNITASPFFAGEQLHVVDLKIYMAVRWFAGGKVDHVPATIFAGYPKLNRVHDAVRDDDRVQAWYAQSS